MGHWGGHWGRFFWGGHWGRFFLTIIIFIIIETIIDIITQPLYINGNKWFSTGQDMIFFF